MRGYLWEKLIISIELCISPGKFQAILKTYLASE